MKLAFLCAVMLFKIIKDYWNETSPKFMIAIELKEKTFFLKNIHVFEITWCFYKLTPWFFISLMPSVWITFIFRPKPFIKYWSACDMILHVIYKTSIFERVFFHQPERSNVDKKWGLKRATAFSECLSKIFCLCKVYFNKLSQFGLSALDFLVHHRLGTGL